MAVLAENYSTGRLDFEVFQARVNRALVAVSRADVDELVADLSSGTGSRPAQTDATPVGRPPRRGWLVAGIAVAAIVVTSGVVQEASQEPSFSSDGACLATGVVPSEGAGCPSLTLAQRQIQRAVDRAAASAAQAATVADGADEGSQAQDLAEAAQAASDEAAQALAKAQSAAATAEPGADAIIAKAVRRADRAADEAARAAIRTGLEASD